MLEQFKNYPPKVLSLFAGAAVVAVSFISSLVPILGLFLNYFSALPLFLMSFAFGLQFGVRAATVAIFGFILFGGAYHAIGFLVITYIPFLLLSYFFLRPDSFGGGFRYPLADVLSKVNLCLLFSLVVSLLGLSFYGIDIRQSVQHFLEQALPSGFLSIQPTAIAHLIDIFPSVLTISWVSTSLVNALLAYQLLARKNLSIRIIDVSKDINFNVYWDIVVTFGFMLIIGHHYWTLPLLSILGKTIMLMGCLPLLALGFRICYLAVQGTESKRFWFAVIIIMSFLLVWPLLIIVLLGFIEPWYGLTQRFAEKNLPN
jgi:hypothetical protein